jgi:hypothetical protein
MADTTIATGAKNGAVFERLYAEESVEDPNQHYPF